MYYSNFDPNICSNGKNVHYFWLVVYNSARASTHALNFFRMKHQQNYPHIQYPFDSWAVLTCCNSFNLSSLMVGMLRDVLNRVLEVLILCFKSWCEA